MVRVNCQNGDGGGSWAGDFSLPVRNCISTPSSSPFFGQKALLRGRVHILKPLAAGILSSSPPSFIHPPPLDRCFQGSQGGGGAVEPEVLQSGFGVKFLFWPGEFWENCRRISQRVLMAIFFCEFFGLVFPGFRAPTKNSRPKFTPRIVGFPLQFHFLEPKTCSRRFSAYGGDQGLCKIWAPHSRPVTRECSGRIWFDGLLLLATMLFPDHKQESLLSILDSETCRGATEPLRPR